MSSSFVQPERLLLVFIDIRTYGVITLNEECGFIQWVSYTTPVRNLIMKMYDQRGIPTWVSHISGFVWNGI